MQKIVKLYKTNLKFKFLFDFGVIFFFIQFCYGLYSSISYLIAYFNFTANFLFLTFVIWSYQLLLHDAQKLGKKFVSKFINFGILYFVISIFITSFLFMRIQTVFSYLGFFIGNIIFNNLWCDHLCLTLKFTLIGSFL